MHSRDVREVASRILRFAGPTAISLITPFIGLPFVSRYADTSSWLALNLGAAVGAIIAIVINFGWNVSGPALAAGVAPAVRDALLRHSVRIRLGVAAAVSPLAFVVCLHLVGWSQVALASTSCLSTAVTGFTMLWFAVSTGRAGLVFGYETIPRAFGTLLGSACVASGLSIVFYPLLITVASIAGWIWFWAIHRPQSGHVSVSMLQTVRRNAGMLGVDLINATWSVGAITLVSLATTALAASRYASGDRLFLVAVAFITVVGNALFGWVIQESAKLRSRLAFALRVHVVLGLTGGLAIWALGPFATRLLYTPHFAVDGVTSAFFGASYFFLNVTTALQRYVLTLRGRTADLLVIATVAAVASVPANLLAAAAWGTSGGAFAMALGQLILAAGCVLASRAEIRRNPLAESDTGHVTQLG